MNIPVRHAWAAGVALLAIGLALPTAARAEEHCREVNILQKQGPAPETCAFDLCGTSTSTAGLGKGTWQTGINFTDVAPPVAPIPETFVLVGTSSANFVADNGDVFFGHSVFVAAPAVSNVSGSVLFMAGGTGRFADATAHFVDIKQRDESTVRLRGTVCGLRSE